MSLKRVYTYKDSHMLLAGKTIIESLKSNLDDLSSIHKDWTLDYIESINKKIDKSIENFFTIGINQELKETTSALIEVQTPATRDLLFLKATIEVDFRHNAPEILKSLGFNKYIKAVQRGNQNALIQLLYTFRASMTESLKNSIAQKGTNPDLIKRIMGYADRLMNFKPTHNIIDVDSQKVTPEAIRSFNDIFLIINGICKIATRYYQFDLLKKEQFIFNKVVRNVRFEGIVKRESNAV